MKLLIIGGSGQVGTSLRYLASGHEVIAPSSRELDLGDETSIKQFIGACRPEGIINAGAYTAVEQAEDEPERAFLLNADGAGWVAEAANDVGAKLVHISTDYVFDGKKGAPYTEEDKPNPLNVYGASKLEGEKRVQAALPEAGILRVSWVFSAVGNNFVKTMVRLATERDEIQVVDDQIGTPCSADFVAEVALKLVESAGQGVYHACTTPAVSWFGFAQAIMEQLDHPPRLAPVSNADYAAKAERPANSLLDARRLEAELDVAAPDWHVHLSNVIRAL